MAMIVNTAWLQEYLDGQCSHEDVLTALPRLGLEVERDLSLRPDDANVRFGFVRKKSPVADAPGMHACEIEIERGRTIPVLCASAHPVEVGWGVPVALAGTLLRGEFRVKEESFHGVPSKGMICLDWELGVLPRDSGMRHVTDETLLGQPVGQAAGFADCLLELNVLPNRPDFLGLMGIVRELAAVLGCKVRPPKTLAPAKSASKPPVPVEIAEPALCTRYIGAAVHGVKVAPSPDWFADRLKLVGLEPINNLVDVTNYVMYECGQPLHAFDLDTLRGRRIVVRRFRPGETMELLTKAVVAADAKGDPSSLPLAIADGERPVALAGVMGGAATRITDGTKNVLLEAAHFDPVNIRQTVKRVQLGVEGRGTDSSYRFERGTDPNSTLELAVGRALQLITALAGGTVQGPVADVYPAPRKPAVIRLKPARAASYLGVPLDAATIAKKLGPLGMECTGGPDEVAVTVPTWRVDATDPVVLIEDVARMIGYDQTPVAPTAAAPTVGGSAPLDRLRFAAAEHLVANGFFECRSPSLESPAASGWLGEPDAAITVSNPATKEMSVLRRSLLPALAETIGNNLRRGAQAARFFEIDRVFGAPGAATGPGGESSGTWRLGAIAGGPIRRSDWQGGGKAFDFYALKGVLEDLVESLGGAAVSFRSVERAPYLPGAAADIVLDGRLAIGTLGEVDAKTLEIDRLSFRVFAWELDIETLIPAFEAEPRYRTLPRQPAVTRDLAVVVPLSANYDDVASAIRQSAGPTLESLQLVDWYQGAQVKSGHASLAFHLVLRDAQRTLTAEEASATIDAVMARLQQDFAAELRA